MMADGKNNDVIDITKLIMAVMVVSIHVNPGGYQSIGAGKNCSSHVFCYWVIFFLSKNTEK